MSLRSMCALRVMLAIAVAYERNARLGGLSGVRVAAFVVAHSGDGRQGHNARFAR